MESWYDLFACIAIFLHYDFISMKYQFSLSLMAHDLNGFKIFTLFAIKDVFSAYLILP